MIEITRNCELGHSHSGYKATVVESSGGKQMAQTAKRWWRTGTEACFSLDLQNPWEWQSWSANPIAAATIGRNTFGQPSESSSKNYGNLYCNVRRSSRVFAQSKERSPGYVACSAKIPTICGAPAHKRTEAPKAHDANAADEYVGNARFCRVVCLTRLADLRQTCAQAGKIGK
jgi:hypothetical protein